MIDLRPIARKILLSFLLVVIISVGSKVAAQDGSQLFSTYCSSCHNPFKVVQGPALKGVEERVTDHALLVSWIKNNAAVLASGNQYFTDLKKQFNGVTMSTFPNLSTADVEAILKYLRDVKPPAPPPPSGQPGSPESDNSFLYGILTLILAVVALIMLQVNSNLKKLADDKENIPAHEPIPFYRNKSYITLITLVLFVVAGFYLVKGAIGLGRTQDYQPEQPIFYSHKVHAGINQINCLYCHGSAWDGRHANIPSVNICMNCHMQINEYTGAEKLYREDGTEVDGTKEIQKVYAAAGWDPKTKTYTAEGHPIAWTRIHSLPDHVYFNHSQHVRAGKVQCQTCHGEITNMNEVYQFAPLSMGWCINCHRTTKVDFNDDKGNGNKYYSIYAKYHEQIRNGERDSVTVEDIGGTECQKCHY
jgi:cytochrome c553